MDQLKRQLNELTALIGLSSREDEVVRYMHSQFRQSTGQVEVDMLGNVTAAFSCGRPDAQRILIFAHMDEVGLMVKAIEPDGFLRLERLTAVNSLVIPGAVYNVRTHQGAYVKGVVGVKSHHFLQADEKDKMPDLHSLFLDIGCRNRQQVLDLGISEGCVVAFQHNFVEMPNNVVSAKSLDDRVGLLVLIHLARHLQGKALPFDVYLTASVQEEFNIRGIMPAARRVDPDIAIGIDITPSEDTPDMPKGGVRLGSGPALTYLNYHGRGTLNGIVPNENLVHFMEGVCEAAQIPFQREVARGLLTETAYVAISGSKGVATVNVSVPTRYAHTPVETACMDDIDGTIRMLCGFLDRWDPANNLKKIAG